MRRFESFSLLILGQARLIEGQSLKDPAGFCSADE